MPNEPEQNNDQALRAYAEQRRAQAAAPGELHPVNRRMLQAEVARVHDGRKTRAAQRLNWFAGLWPRLATVSVIVIAGVFAFQFVRDDAAPEGTVAQMVTAEPEPSARVADRPAAAGESATPAPVTLHAVAAADEVRVPAQRDRQNIVSEPQMLGRSVDARRSVVTRGTGDSTDALAAAPPAPGGLAYAGAPAPATAAKPAAGPVATTAAAPAQFFKQKADASAGAAVNETRARFVRAEVALGVAPESKASAMTTPVLDRFAIEQSGRELRFLDADGSVYTGAVEFAIAETNAGEDVTRGKKLEIAPALSQARQQTRSYAVVATNSLATTQWTFNAYGINRTLQQPVVVNGSLEGKLSFATNVEALMRYGVSAQNAALSGVQKADAAQGKAQAYDAKEKAGGAPVDAYQLNYQRVNATRIQGKVRVGSNSPVQNLDALPESK